MAYMLKVGDYDINIRTEIGSGTFGKVYRGRHSTSRIDIAAKKIVLRETQSRDESVHEHLKVLSRMVHHNHISQLMHHDFVDYVDEFEKEVHELWLITEYHPAGNLAQYCKAYRVQFEDTVRISQGCASAIAFLHNLDPRILHCDIKPGNVLITNADGIDSVKIADFGLAYYNGSSGLLNARGSVQYMPPELFAPQCIPGKSFDVFSLGVLYGHLIKAPPGQDLEDEACE